MDFLGTLTATDRPKNYFQGTHRTCTPQETLNRLRPHFSRMGLTRLSEVTRLDRVGVPVAQSVRPMARSVSVNQGKGLTRFDALTSAAMEAAETWHAENAELEVVVGSARSLGLSDNVVDLKPICVVPDNAPSLPEEMELRWVVGTDLLSKDKILVPSDFVVIDYTSPPECEFIHRSTNGLASGNTLAEATAAALYEVIERDCLTDFRLETQREKRARLVRRDALNLSSASPYLEAIQAAGLWIDVWDIANDLDVPAFHAMICEAQAGSRSLVTRPVTGSGCHFDPAVALSRAVSEALQARVTLISGARDDIQQDCYVTDASSVLARITSTLFELNSGSYLGRSNSSGESSGEDVSLLTRRLAEQGCGPIVVVDLSDENLPISVVRVIVPGLAVQTVSGPNKAGIRGAHRSAAELDF